LYQIVLPLGATTCLNICIPMIYLQTQQKQVFLPSVLTTRDEQVITEVSNDHDRYISVGLIIKDNKILMIGRSNKKKGYVFPKGGCENDEWPFSGLTALREVYEEAGCVCEIVEEDVTNNYTLSTKRHNFFVYKLQVIQYLDDYPEKEKRSNMRKWMTFEEALDNFNDMKLDNPKKNLYIDMLEYGFGVYCGSRGSLPSGKKQHLKTKKHNKKKNNNTKPITNS